MAERETHYEVMLKDADETDWRLIGVKSDRDEALKYSQDVLADTPGAAVRVLREVFHERSRTFRSRVVFQRAHGATARAVTTDQQWGQAQSRPR